MARHSDNDGRHVDPDSNRTGRRFSEDPVSGPGSIVPKVGRYNHAPEPHKGQPPVSYEPRTDKKKDRDN